jgi:hypothetical protein
MPLSKTEEIGAQKNPEIGRFFPDFIFNVPYTRSRRRQPPKTFQTRYYIAKVLDKYKIFFDIPLSGYIKS